MEHWTRMARQWAQVGAPLRPGDDDLAAVAAIVAAWTRAHAYAPRAMVLGVTPELLGLPWPAGTRLVAIDRARAMIGGVFRAAPGRDAATADWRALPLAAGAIDLAVGDGCLSCLPFPAGYRAFAGELARVLADGGRLHLRLFARPPQPETIDDVAGALAAGAIAGFHALKWRVAMALVGDDRGVRVADVWRAFAALAPDRDALVRRTGWDRAAIDTIDAYRDSPAVYSFPSEAEAVDALAGALVPVARHAPGYELGDRCPSIAWRAR